MLEAGADVSADGELALRWAAEGGWTEIVEILLSAGADPHYDDDEPVRIAVNNSYDDMVRLFQQHLPSHEQKFWLKDYAFTVGF